MIRRVFSTLILLCVLAVSPSVVTAAPTSANSSVMGKWQTRDEKTGEPSSVITIWQERGLYFGKISKIYSMKSHQPLERCLKCKGDQYNQPILGLTIIKNLKEEEGKYVDGTILDPRSGKEYHCTLQVIKGGQELKVRGYLGVSLFGQTRIWYRL